MNRYTFSTQTGKAYYCNSVPEFINDNSADIVQQLIRHSFEINLEQYKAWENQISELQNRLKKCQMEGDIIFEYDIIRLGKRIDVILLIRHMVFSIEFKNGVKGFVAKDAQQAEDYAIDLKNFHKESEDLYVCPILVVTDAAPYHRSQSCECYSDKQVYLQRENIETLVPKITDIAELYGDDGEIDFEKWFNSPYHPTPTIIAAAVEAYRTHDLSEIANSEAGQSNIDQCEKALKDIINYAKINNKKCVCFVTGVPGAGKTLVGLDVVAKSLDFSEDMHSVYISGNGPLVEVLQEALRQSVRESNKRKNIILTKHEKELVDESIGALIQGSFSFKKAHAKESSPPVERILIFDEAQRVWNQQKMASKHNDPKMAVSEPHLLFNIMDRHENWAVMICLVGLGQDIYDGEVGINEWFRCGVDVFVDWEMYYSPEIFSQVEDKNIDRTMIEGCSRCHKVPELHLKTSIRSFRADKQCEFIDQLLDNNPQLAEGKYKQINEKYPVFITREYEKAKQWVRAQVRGSQRSGVLACSSAQRLKPEGIFVSKDIDVKSWFLAPSDDLRSSNRLEIVASEFKVQGLEIDWAIVCWDADLRRNKKNEGWEYYSFRGTSWNRRNKEEQKRYLLNSYRVLLTRARQGMVIFVPRGADPEEDSTRNHQYYDDIYKYLLSCGIKELP